MIYGMYVLVLYVSQQNSYDITHENGHPSILYYMYVRTYVNVCLKSGVNPFDTVTTIWWVRSQSHFSIFKKILTAASPTASLASLTGLDGNKLAKGMYLARKVRYREVFI